MKNIKLDTDYKQFIFGLCLGLIGSLPVAIIVLIITLLNW